MELDEMKSLWADLSLQVEKQDKIQKEILLQITKQKFRDKMNRIRIPEILGSLVCVGYAMYFLSHFSDLELWYNQVFAMVTILIMIALPTASLTAIKGMQNIRIDSEKPAVLLEKFIQNKVRFWKVQQYGVFFGAIVMVTILPPLSELNDSLSAISTPIFWMIYIPLGLVFLLIFSRWLLKKYKRVIESSEKMLQELDL